MKIHVKILLVFMLAALSCSQGNNNIIIPMAEKGVLDLSAWDFDINGPVKLDGQWQFYWDRFLDGKELASIEKSKQHFEKVPKIWNSYSVNRDNHPRNGFATFHLTIKMPRERSKLGIKISEINTAYRLFLNDIEIARAGTVADNRENTDPKFLPVLVPINAEEDRVTVTIHVANFHYNRGGILVPIYLGKHDQLTKMQNNSIALEFFLFGSLLIMALYHFGVYILRRTDISYLLFALFCFFICIRVPATGENILALFYPDIPWFINFKLKYMSFPALPLFFSFIYMIFRDYTNRRLSMIIFIFCCAVGLSVFIVPMSIQGYFMEPFMFITLLTCSYVLYILFRSSINKNAEAFIVLSGFIILFIAIVNDLLQETYQIYLIKDILPFGVFFFILSQSFVLSLRFSMAFKRVEIISDELKEKNEALIRYDKMKDDFLASTSHELRTPLSGIIGLAETLHDNKLKGCDEEIEEDLSVIVSSGKRLSSMVNSILDFSRLKYDTISLKLEPVDMFSSMSEHISLLKPLVKGKNIKLLSKINRDEYIAFADRERVSQILHNLIGNAIKFTIEGEIIISARKLDGLIFITISDTGIGIAEDKVESIFKPYEQADDTISRQFGGTGLGLTITRHLVELHGGTISIESIEGKGTDVTFTLPLYTGQEAVHESPVKDFTEIADAALEIPRSSLYSAADHTGTFSHLFNNNVHRVRGTLLIVDDEPINIHVLKNILEVDGHKVLTSSTGTQCLDIMKDTAPDLVILDIMMPGISGYDVALEIRRKYNLLELPILMISARSQTEDILSGFDCGINDYISKPFDKNELSARVRTLLEMRRGYVEREKLTILEKDLDVARTLQKSILTKRDYYRKISGYDIDVRYYPVNNRISGDYYNIHRNKDGSLAVFLADATGHGIQAALFTSQIDVLYKDSLFINKPHKKLDYINTTLISEIGTHNFFTALSVMIKDDTLYLSGAGHHDQIIYRGKRNEFEILQPRGKIIGLTLNADYSLFSTEMSSDDILILFSDGVYDIDMPSFPEKILDIEDALGMLKTAFKNSKMDFTTSKISDMIIEEVQKIDKGITFNDDTTMIIIKRN